MEIEIFPIQTRFDTVYIVRGDGIILIDGGDPQKIAKVKLGIEKASIEPKEIQLIVLTHGHWDHIGSVRDIKDLTGAKVLLHQKDMHLLDDTPPSQPPGFTPWGKFIIALLKLATRSVHIPRFDVILHWEERCPGQLWDPGKWYAPQDTRGDHKCGAGRGSFVGDLAMNMAPALQPWASILVMICDCKSSGVN
jgi:glyoxylase-like metal-dependent hydrolase (beta-lactamase superfamily II)